MSFKVNVNNSSLGSLSDSLKEKFMTELKNIIDQSANAAMSHAVSLADEKLKSRKMQFIQNLEIQKHSDLSVSLTLKSPARWINDGVEGPYDMRDTLLKRGYKTSKEGHKYRSIPFKQSKAPSNMSPREMEVNKILQAALKQKGIPYKKIEYNNDGSPKMGRLHTMDIASPKPTPTAKSPALSGLNIYQNKTMSGKVEREAMTFRTISEKGRGTSWMNPGTAPTNIMEQTAEWLKKEIAEVIIPSLLRDINK